jgi:hypothetical protein
MIHRECLCGIVCLILIQSVQAQEALPIPKQASPPRRAPTKVAPSKEEQAQEEAAMEEGENATDEPVVVGNLEHQGWSLAGPRGRFYFFGGLAVADYAYQGDRRIVTLQQEEPTLLPKPDEKFLYYHELASGNRWAVGREPLASGSYIIYFQLREAAKSAAAGLASSKSAAPQKTWQEFQRAHLEFKK